MKKVLMALAIWCVCVPIFAQLDTSKIYTTKAASIYSEPAVSTSVKIVENDKQIEKNFVQNTLADALIQNNLIHVKSYGTGLQSVSFRGTGAEHTAVYWEGVPVNSSMNGITDFSLLPSFLLQDVSLNFGDGGAAYGSNAVGGAVLLKSKLEYKLISKVYTEINMGSFSNYSGGIGYVWANKKLASTTKLFIQDAKNDYFYEDKFTAGKPDKRIKNNALNTIGGTQKFGYRSRKGELNLSTIVLSSNRELANVSNPNANETQDDISSRTVFSYKRNTNTKWSYKVNVGHSYEYLNYVNPGFENSEYAVNSILGDFQFKKQFKTNYVIGFVKYLNQIGDAANYTQDPSRVMTDIGATYYNKFKRFESRTTVRATHFKKAILPLNFGQLLKYKLRWKEFIKFGVNSVYRLPTFNDLYWKGSGNLALKPEHGWKEDLSYSRYREQWGMEIGVYHIQMNNWMIWLPDSGVWRPNNVRKVRSYGLETQVHRKIKIKKAVLILKGTYSYTNSQNVEVEKGNETARNKQLIYIPYHKFGGVITLKYKRWNFISTANYTGEIYTTSDNSATLDPFMIFSTSLSKEFGKEKHRGIIALSLRNLLDERYEVVDNRPVPGRSIWLKLSYNLNFKYTKPLKFRIPKTL